ncbi:hypothetical protein ACIHCQ_41280 [Streptomyces sp. NPDC052236]|uniref:hypothetical protein n=1 Tax=Streptomyces sp. NPDC052236 TaxID=3365686 RepID=UPI0037D8E1A2
MFTIRFAGGPLAGLEFRTREPWVGSWYRFESSDQWTLYVAAHRDSHLVLAVPRVQAPVVRSRRA